MTKAELVEKIAEEAGITKKAANSVLRAFVGAVHSKLTSEDGSIKVANLGTFRIVDRKARIGVNPRTGQRMTIPARRSPGFTPSKALRATVPAEVEEAHDPCADPEGMLDKVMCKVCGLPGVGDLPFCKDHQHHHS